MEIIGKVVRHGTLVEGTSARGPWRKQELIIETEEQYPRTVCLICWTNQIEEIQKFAPGQTIKAQIDLSSREFNGKWYTDVRVWRFDPVGATTAPAAAPAQPAQQPMMHQTPPVAAPAQDFYPPAEDSVDDLPF
ncbi:MAG: DUF3127 domain-containing protein [Bacteroidales bacterium]|nr:DUF3127 domain-containing protein [Bacteroidales bacterium]